VRRAIGALDCACNFNARRDVDIADDVSHVRLDGLLTEEERFGYL